MVKDRRGSGEGGAHEERGGRGELQNTLLSHKCMCEHTPIQAYTLVFTYILYVHMKAHTILAPGGQFHKQAYVGRC